MTGFSVRAVDANGRLHRCYFETDNIAEIEDQLIKSGLELVQYKRRWCRDISFFTARVSSHDRMSFTIQLQQLLYSGVPVLDGLKDLRDVYKGAMKDVLSALIAGIEKGQSLSESMKLHPQVFDEVYITLVKVGEESGRLPEVFQDLAETLKWQDELLSHARKMVIYPAIVSLVVMGLVIFLMVFMVPQLVPFIEYSGGDIPPHTRALIATSTFIGNYAMYLIGFFLSGIVVIRAMARNHYPIRLAIDRAKLNISIIGSLILKTSMARFAGYFAMMYRAGITVPEALGITEKLLANVALENALRKVREKIEEGESLANSFESAHIFPPLVIRMIKLGETTGLLDEALLNVSYFYNRDVKETVDKLEELITPVLTILLGIIILWIMSAVLGPIYDAISQIQG